MFHTPDRMESFNAGHHFNPSQAASRRSDPPRQTSFPHNWGPPADLKEYFDFEFGRIQPDAETTPAFTERTPGFPETTSQRRSSHPLQKMPRFNDENDFLPSPRVKISTVRPARPTTTDPSTVPFLDRNFDYDYLYNGDYDYFQKSDKTTERIRTRVTTTDKPSTSVKPTTRPAAQLIRPTQRPTSRPYKWTGSGIPTRQKVTETSWSSQQTKTRKKTADKTKEHIKNSLKPLHMEPMFPSPEERDEFWPIETAGIIPEHTSPRNFRGRLPIKPRHQYKQAHSHSPSPQTQTTKPRMKMPSRSRVPMSTTTVSTQPSSTQPPASPEPKKPDLYDDYYYNDDEEYEEYDERKKPVMSIPHPTNPEYEYVYYYDYDYDQKEKLKKNQQHDNLENEQPSTLKSTKILPSKQPKVHEISSPVSPAKHTVPPELKTRPSQGQKFYSTPSINSKNEKIEDHYPREHVNNDLDDFYEEQDYDDKQYLNENEKFLPTISSEETDEFVTRESIKPGKELGQDKGEIRFHLQKPTLPPPLLEKPSPSPTEKASITTSTTTISTTTTTTETTRITTTAITTTSMKSTTTKKVQIELPPMPTFGKQPPRPKRFNFKPKKHEARKQQPRKSFSSGTCTRELFCDVSNSNYPL